MTQSGPENPEYVFERNGRRYLCWAALPDVAAAGVENPLNAHWNVRVEGHDYRLFEAHADDLRDESMTQLLEDRILEALQNQA